MAASIEDVAATLTMEDIPAKLRCAACNQLANDAFRLPCCDQIICDKCQESLPEVCPVCLHEPIKKEDCRPNKALRTTVRIFLKKKIVDRENARKQKELLERPAVATPGTPIVEETPAPKPSEAAASDTQESKVDGIEPKLESQDTSQVLQRPKENDADGIDKAIPTEAQRDIPQMSIESPGVEMPRRDSTQTAGDGSVGQDKSDDAGKPADQQWANMSGNGQSMTMAGLNFDSSNGFPNMGINAMGDFSQMMQFMPNGMPNPMMAAFPNMMGMPGMMDPTMMSSGLYGGFGGQGMGMNGMNMGMGFDASQGAFGGNFNAQPSWNAGQNKFNQNSYGGQTGSDFGANAGSYGTGYNMPQQSQGNFNQMNHHHNYPNNDFHHGHNGQGFQGRGRGRGRGYQYYGGRGRGGYSQYNQYNSASQGNYANSESYQQQNSSEVTRRGSPQYGEKLEQPLQQHQTHNDGGEENSTNSFMDQAQLDKELNPGDADDDMPDPALQPLIREDLPAPVQAVPSEVKSPDEDKTSVKPAEDIEEKPAPIKSYVPDEAPQADAPPAGEQAATAPTMMPPPGPTIPKGPAALYSGDMPLDTSPRGRGAGRGYYRGHDYHAGPYGRGSGYVSNSNLPRAQPFTSPSKPVVPPVAPKGLGVEGAPKGPKALREGSVSNVVKGFSIAGRASATLQARPNGIAQADNATRDRSRSPSKHQSSSHRTHRHRSASPSTEEDRERRRERHHRHSRKYEDENGDINGNKESRTRDASADSSSKRSSHRSRRDHEKDRDRDRDRDRSSHRSHRKRDRSRESEDHHKSSKKRSPSPEISIHGASRINGVNKPSYSSRQKAREDEIVQSSRKRRSDDEEYRREHKRSRRDREEPREDEDDGHRSDRRPRRREEKESRSNRDRPQTPVTPNDEPENLKAPPKGPKIDQHAIEREARNAERVARENQRRAQMGGGGGTGKGGSERASAKGGGKNMTSRRSSYKYEDEDMTSKVETEREASRYR